MGVDVDVQMHDSNLKSECAADLGMFGAIGYDHCV